MWELLQFWNFFTSNRYDRSSSHRNCLVPTFGRPISEISPILKLRIVAYLMSLDSI